VLEAAYAAARLASRSRQPSHVAAPTSADADLVAPREAQEGWTVSGADAWEWYAGSGVLQTIDVGGRYGSRAIVRLDRVNEAPLQIVAWRPARSGLAPALLLLGTAARLARRNGAPTLRFQPWAGRGGDGALAAACKALGFVRRKEADLLLHASDAAAVGARVQLTPFFYVTF
jgi:hypothetical protein